LAVCVGIGDEGVGAVVEVGEEVAEDVSGHLKSVRGRKRSSKLVKGFW
jgi:hypothetical protein